MLSWCGEAWHGELMVNFGAYLTGAFGQSQQLYEVRNEAKRGLGSEEAVQQQILEDTKRVIQAQLESGLDFIIDPLFGYAHTEGWGLYDLFQPFVEIPGITQKIEQRNWFKNNLFYNPLKIVQGFPITTGWAEKNLYPDLLPKDGQWMVIFPSPYTVLQLSEISGYHNKKSAIADIAQLIKAEAKHLVSLGARRVQYDEPSIVYKQYFNTLEQEDLELLQIAIEICGSIPGATTCLHSYFEDAAPLLSYFRELPIDGIGIDATITEIGPILQQNFSDKELVLGLVDARCTAPEDPRELVVELRKVAEHCQPKALWVTPTSGTKYNGYTHGLRKIEILKKTKELFHA